MAKKMLDAAGISELVEKAIKSEKDAITSSGSTLLDSIREIAKRASLGEATPKDGETFAIEYDAKWRAAHMRAPAECGKSVYGGVAAMVRIGAQKKWWSSFFDHLAEMHKAAPLSYTMMRALGRRASSMKDCPSVEKLAEEKSDVLAKAAGGGSGSKTVYAKTAIAALIKTVKTSKEWKGLPAEAKKHIGTVLKELTTAHGLCPDKE